MEDSKPDYGVATLIIAVGLVAVGLLWWAGLAGLQQLAKYLNLILPLAVTLLSILTRVSDTRTYESVLKVSSDIAIGIISFDIWALSARRPGSGRVEINDAQMISGEFVLPLLLFGLVTSVACVVLNQYDFRNNERKRRRWLLSGLVFACVVYVLPFFALQPIPPVAEIKAEPKRIHYSVLIPFQDKALQAAKPAWFKERLLAVFLPEPIEAASAQEARASAVGRFMQLPMSDSFERKWGKVEVQQDLVLAAPLEQGK